jgi:hypothetical protein
MPCTLQGTRTGPNYDGAERNLARFFLDSDLTRLADVRVIVLRRNADAKSKYMEWLEREPRTLGHVSAQRGFACSRLETDGHFRRDFLAASISVAIRAVAIFEIHRVVPEPQRTPNACCGCAGDPRAVSSLDTAPCR